MEEEKQEHKGTSERAEGESISVSYEPPSPKLLNIKQIYNNKHGQCSVCRGVSCGSRRGTELCSLGDLRGLSSTSM